MAENNPFPQSPPDSLRDVDEELFFYLQEQATMLRTFNDQVLYGQVVLDEGELTRFYTEALYPLGTTASVLHGTFGPMLIQFVQYDRMSATTPLGHPVGISSRNPDAGAWFVTNDIKESTSENALGLLGGTRLPVTGEFGWIIIQGANPFPIVLKAGLNTSLGMGFVWIDDGAEGALDDWAVTDGALLGKQVVLESFNPSIPAGSLVLTSDANSVSAISQGLQAQLTQLSLDLDGTNVLVATNKVAQVDGDTALGIRIDEIEVSSGDNTASVIVERAARIEGDAILAISVEELETSVGLDIAAAVQTETTARIDGDTAVASSVTSLDTRLSDRIDVNQQTAANAVTSISALTTTQTAQTESTTRLEASLKDGSAENLLPTNAESEQTGPFIYIDKELLTSVGLIIGEAVSFGGPVRDPVQHDAVDAGWQIEFFDQLNSSLGVFESNLIDFTELQAADFTADSTLITADSTLFTADSAGAVYRQIPLRENIIVPAMAFSYTFRAVGGANSADTVYGPVTLVRGPVFRAFNKVTAFASATETLEARVTVNEAGLVVASAKWSVILDVNGRVTGLILVDSSETESQFRVIVDNFLVFNGTGDEAVFEINGGVAQMKAANIANLDAGKITTGELIADRIQIDNVTLDTLAGNLIIKADGVNTTQLADNAATKISYAEDLSPPAVTTTSTVMVAVTHTNTTVNNIIKEGFLQLSSDIDETVDIVLSVSPGVALIFEHRIFGGSHKQLVSIREIAKDVLGDLGTSFSVNLKKNNGSASVTCHVASITITEFTK